MKYTYDIDEEMMILLRASHDHDALAATQDDKKTRAVPLASNVYWLLTMHHFRHDKGCQTDNYYYIFYELLILMTYKAPIVNTLYVFPVVGCVY